MEATFDGFVLDAAGNIVSKCSLMGLGRANHNFRVSRGYIQSLDRVMVSFAGASQRGGC